MSRATEALIESVPVTCAASSLRPSHSLCWNSRRTA